MAKNTRTAFFVICDFVCFNASYLLAYLLYAFFSDTDASYFTVFTKGFLLPIGVKLLAMYASSVYKILFEYAGVVDFRRVALSVVSCTLAAVTASVVLGIDPALPPLIILFSFVFDMVFVIIIRVLYVRQAAARTYTRRSREDGEDADGAADGKGSASIQRRYTQQRKRADSGRRTMIIGANSAAADIIAEMQAGEGGGRKPAVIIDDEKTHAGSTLLGVEIASGRGEIRLRARRQSIDEIIIAKPGANRRQIAALLRDCVKTRCLISILSPPSAGANGASGESAAPPCSLTDLRKPTVGDLLGRDLPRVPHREIDDQVRGRIVLVTGGAGVFGAELCRRIIRYRPRRLIAMDIDEDGLAMLAGELAAYRTAETEFRTVIASVRDATMMRRVFGAFRPHIVFHAAELAQIPLAQANPREAFLTNALGLKTACDLADEFAAEKFILCSSVRAADPTNVYAQCKRIAEMYIEEKNERSQTAYASVRVPNLTEGAGNVIAVFERQLLSGGPLTVTDKDIVRRFIGAEEAALLTVRAAVIAQGGEIFGLGPGEPFGIRELAEALIRLDGKIPYEDIGIVVTQLRAGERLFEKAGDEQLRAGGSADRIWAEERGEAARLPHWSQLWVQDEGRMDDAAVMEILRLVFPTYKTTHLTGGAMRGERIENE